LKSIEYFEKLLKSSSKHRHFTENYFTVNERYLLASCEASYFIAKSTKPFSAGEDLVLPAAIKMSEIVHGKNTVMKFAKFFYLMTPSAKESVKLVMINYSS